MTTSPGLRSGFDYDLEYVSGGMGLDEFEPEDERAAFAVAERAGRVEVRLDGLEARLPSGQRLRFGMLIAAALVVAAAAWLAMRQPPGSPAPNAPNAPPAPPPAAAESAAPPPAVAFSDAAVEPREIAPEAARPAAKPQPPPRQAASEPPRAAIDEALAGVSQAYRTLDAEALGAVWPGADAAALSRRFSSLKYQSLSFDACDVRTAGPDQAVASCAVSIAAASKAGDPSLQHRRESWTIVLARKGEQYLVTGVSIR